MKKRSTIFRRIHHLTTSYEGRVKFNEVDALGIVWHGHYISFFEEGREAFGRRHSLDYLNIHDRNFTTPVVTINCDYKLPLRYGDTYTIKTYILDYPGAKIMLEYEIYNINNKLVCTGKTIQVFVNQKGEMALYPPNFFENWKKEVDFYRG